jgi:hypothetical protein
MSSRIQYSMGDVMLIVDEFSIHQDHYYRGRGLVESGMDLPSMFVQTKSIDLVVLCGELPPSWEKKWLRTLPSSTVERYLHSIYRAHLTNTVTSALTDVNAPFHFTAMAKDIAQALCYIQANSHPFKSADHALPALAFMGGATCDQVDEWIRDGILTKIVKMMVTGVEPDVAALSLQHGIDPDLVKSLKNGSLHSLVTG